MEDRELFIRAQKGENSAKEQLFDKNKGLVHHVMKRFVNRSNVEAEDLFQIGSMGLLKAIEKFDIDYGVCFSTYAVPLIIGEIRRYIRDDGLIKVSRNIKENGRKLRYLNEQMQIETGKEPAISELAKRADMIPEDVVMALDASSQVESIYKPVYEADGREVLLLDMLGGESESEKIVDRLLVEKLIGGLGERERTLIRLRYFENKTQVQTADNLGMSQVQVSRLEKKILLDMRKKALV
jgi:RNA polymerase sporulation-specific sigma factor